MRKLLVFFSMIIAAAFIAVNFTSCGDSEDPIPAPTVAIDAVVDGHMVTFAIVATDATSFRWDYGDGNTSTESTAHDYEYEYSGEYTVTATVTNETGSNSATVTVIIDPEPEEILSGTPDSHPDGKTWVLDPKYYPGKNGAGPITPDMPITQDFLVDNVLEVMLGLGVEYDNEFTFKYDGSLSIDNKNEISLGGQLYSIAVAGTGPAPGFEGGSGLCGVSYTPEAGGTFEFKQEDLSMDVIVEDPADLEAGWTEETLSMSNQMTIVPTDYFGLLEITKTVLIKEITSEAMHVVFFMHGVVEVPMKPSTAIHVTFIPKE